MVLTRFIKTQLFIFTLLTVLAVIALSVFYLRLPTVAGIGRPGPRSAATNAALSAARNIWRHTTPTAADVQQFSKIF
jgi:hypothetical protein